MMSLQTTCSLELLECIASVAQGRCLDCNLVMALGPQGFAFIFYSPVPPYSMMRVSYVHRMCNARMLAWHDRRWWLVAQDWL